MEKSLLSFYVLNVIQFLRPSCFSKDCIYVPAQGKLNSKTISLKETLLNSSIGVTLSPSSVSSIPNQLQPRAGSSATKMVHFFRKNHRFLKLVHNGGYVEILRNPITAAEVMKRNPRHCVARPDVFKFPWIVVRPESILKPGGVFFIVPYYTMYRLLQRNKLRSSCDEETDDHGTIESDVYREGENLVFEKTDELMHFHQLMKNKCPNRFSCPQDRMKVDCSYTKDGSFRKCLIAMTADLSLDSSGEIVNGHQDSVAQQTPSADQPGLAFPPCRSSSEDTYVIKPDVEQQFGSSDERRRVKSCLKKHKSAKSFRVRFTLPGPNREKIIVNLEELKEMDRKDDVQLEFGSSEEGHTLKSCLKKKKPAKSPSVRVKFALPGRYGDNFILTLGKVQHTGANQT